MTNTNFDTNDYAIFLPQVILLSGCGTYQRSNSTLSDFKWSPPNEADLYTCEITGEHAQHWCKNGYPDLCSC